MEQQVNMHQVSNITKIVVVNSTAAVSGGALTILNEFISTIVRDNDYPYLKFVFFTAVDFPSVNAPNIKIVNVGKKNYLERVLWDYIGFNRYIRKNDILPQIIMSFQNSGVSYDKDCPQLIYFHNPFSLMPHNWNPLKRNERVLWFYTKVYPFFVKSLINNNTRIIVQAEWIKKAFAKRFKLPANKITVILPTVKKDQFNCISKHNEKMILFFPATAFVYKNHALLLDMLQYLKDKDLAFFKQITLVFTLNYENIVYLGLEKRYKLVKDNVILSGYLIQEEMSRIYNESQILVFPSKIETFGLPLIEAAYKNKFILCSDEAYAHETLEGYKNVEFVDNKNHVLWGERCYAHLKNIDSGSSNESNNLERPDSWFKVIDLVKEMVN